MVGPAWNIDWEFAKQAVCFNCRTSAEQRLRVLPVGITVACAHCGAERIFTIHGTLGTSCELPPEPEDHRYDIWHFTRKAGCSNCGSESEHEITMNEYRTIITCPICCFSHLYNFSVYTRGPQRP